MAELTLQTIVEAGLEETFVAAAGGGDFFQNNEADVFLHVKNDDASDTTITVTAQDVVQAVPGFGDLTKADAVVVVTAGEERMIGPFPKQAFNDSAGDVQVTYSGVTSLTVAAVRLPKAR